jgi:hypothetical protein
MAPGCTSVIQQHQNQQDKELVQYDNKNFTDFVYSNVQEANSEDNNNLLERNNYYVRYDEIYLDQIPLPLTPPPDESTETIFSFDQHNQQDKQPINQQLLIADTIDSFEILEQTIMKQKRMAKTKNSDLRLKVLLKRTFNLVCEIMDHENGFDSDLGDDSSVIEITQDVKENFDEDSEDDGSDSDEDTDEQENESDEDDEDDDEKEEHQPSHDKIIPNFETNTEKNIQQSDSIQSQIDFQTISLNQFEYVDYDNQPKQDSMVFSLSDEQLLNDQSKSNDFICLEPIVSFFDQQIVSNKRKLTEDIDSEVYVKRFKLNRSLSSSDEENDLNYVSNRIEPTSNSYLFNNLTNNDLIIKSSRKDESSIKMFKLSSINFYA